MNINIKKIFKILLLNLFLTIPILLLFEIYFCFFNALENTINIKKINSNINKFDFLKNGIKFNIINYSSLKPYIYFNRKDFRPPALYLNSQNSQTYDKKSIIIAGCSFAYGDFLENTEAFHSQLSKYTHRNVFNLGLSGGSTREILYILKNKNILNNLVDNPNNVEYFIYIYIDDHKKRLYSNVRPLVPSFISIKNYKKLQYINIPLFINHSYLIRYINKFLYHKGFFINQNKLFKLYMKETKDKLKTNLKNSEFLILVYEYNPTYKEMKMFKELEKDGFKIIYLDKILNVNIHDKKYKLEDGHPNAKAWEVIVPALAKELNL